MSSTREPRPAVGITSDSRAATPGCAFVALRGDRMDGHAHVQAAIDAGAALVIVERGRGPEGDRAEVVEVSDTLAAWGALARAHLRAWRHTNARARTVAITGSAGKTTTKELCAALLREAGACHATAGNLNNRVGVPAVAFGVEPRHRFSVFEVGMSVPGEIAALAAIVDPDVAVITNAGLAHAGGVGGTVDDVAREKGALFQGLRAGGAVIANADDPAVMNQIGRAPSPHVTTFGTSSTADVRLAAREPAGVHGCRVRVERRGRPAEAFVVPIAGEAAAIDFVAALAAAEAAAGGPLDARLVAAALVGLPSVPGRMQIRALGEGVVAIDDAYNANPTSMRAALSTLSELGGGRRVAVLGEMKELGVAAEREHASIGEAAAAAGVSLLISCGGLADTAARVAAGRGVETVLTTSADEAAKAAAARVRAGDVVLIKASRSVGAERVVEALVRKYGLAVDAGAKARALP